MYHSRVKPASSCQSQLRRPSAFRRFPTQMATVRTEDGQEFQLSPDELEQLQATRAASSGNPCALSRQEPVISLVCSTCITCHRRLSRRSTSCGQLAGASEIVVAAHRKRSRCMLCRGKAARTPGAFSKTSTWPYRAVWTR